MICSLVTGAAGFIGSHLTEKLLELGHRVIGIDDLSSGRMENINHLRQEHFHFIQKDIRQIESVKLDCEINYVFHLAGKADIVPSITNPQSYFDANVQGTFQMLEWSRRQNIKKFIYAASSSCYGIAGQIPSRESDPVSPQYPYALMKYLGEQMVIHWAKVYKLPTISLRLFNVFGPRSRTSGAYGAVMGVFLSRMANNLPITIVSNGEQRRDFIYIEDVVWAFIKASWSDFSGEIFNVGRGITHSVNELADLLGAKEREFIPKRPGEPEVTWANISRTAINLDWAPRTTFEAGIEIMKKEISKYKSAPLWTKESINNATKEWHEALS